MRRSLSRGVRRRYHSPEMQKSSKRLSTAVRGTDGFVCVVAPSWSADFDDPAFWDPGLRAPICYNALVARSQAPATLKWTRVVLAGGANAVMVDMQESGLNGGHVARASLSRYCRCTISPPIDTFCVNATSRGFFPRLCMPCASI